MSRTVERVALDDKTRLFLLEQDADDLEAGMSLLVKKMDSIIKLMITVLISMMLGTVTIAGSVVLAGGHH